MARTKARETYGNGSVSPVMVAKTDKQGNAVTDKDGKPVKVQKRDKQGRPGWRVCVSLGTQEYADKSGRLRKRQRKQQRVMYGSLEEARSVAKQLTEDYESLDPDKANDNFSALYREWLSSRYCPKCSKMQKRQYEKHLGYMAVFLDGKRLIDVKAKDIENALDAVRNRRGEKTLSASTMNKILDVTKRVFEFAIDRDYIMRNPCRRIHKFETEGTDAKQQRSALSGTDAFRLRVALDEQERFAYAAFEAKEQRQADWGKSDNRTSVYGLSNLASIIATRLLLATGARRGEILGLTWNNVNLSEGIIRISQSLSVEMEVKAPKTDAGIRNLYIDGQTLGHLKKWETFQEKVAGSIKRDAAPVPHAEAPVFISDVGGWIGPTNYSRWWRDFREAIGFEKLLTHELRHTHVTLLEPRIPEYMLKTRIGHSRPHSATTFYLHEQPAHDELAAKVMEQILYHPEEQKSKVIELGRRTA